MFTGIVEELGTVTKLAKSSGGARIEVRCATVLSDLSIGASIAVNGVCLTAVQVAEDGFAADLAPETIARTNLGDLTEGAGVNLERPVTPATRLSGHIVQGHVDATGEVVALDALDTLSQANWWLKVRVPQALGKYLVEKGSITLDGISLTIATLGPDQVVGLTIIPHTYANTTIGQARAGTRINIEVDVLAKHVEKLLAHK